MSQQRLFLLILLGYILLATGYSLVTPLGEGPDEADHYAYARYIGLNHHLPEGPDVTQSKHPPLYHAAAAVLTAWTGMDFDFLHSNPDAFPIRPDAPPNFFVHTTQESFPWRGGVLAMRLARFLSILLGGVTVWASWQTGRVLFPRQPHIGLLAAAFLAGLPGFLVISGVMNNDNAAGVFGSLILLLSAQILRRGVTYRRSLLLGLALGLGLLSKVGVLAVWPLAGLAIVAALWPERRSKQAWMRGLAHVVLTYGLGLLIASPWLLRNWRLYGDPLGWSLVRATVDVRTAPLTPADLLWLARGLYGYFWGRFGPIGQVHQPAWVYGLAGVFLLALLAGVIRFCQRERHQGSPFLLGLLLLAAAPLLVWASIVRYSAIALGTDQARLMWPAIAAMAIWIGMGAAGWQDMLQKRLRPRLAGLGFGLFMTGFGFLSLLFVVAPAYAPPRPVQMAPTSALARFGENLELLQVILPENPLPSGTPVPVRLLWRASGPIHDDLRPVVRLYHNDGWLAAEHDHSPAQGRYPTDRWRPGEVIADDYLLQPDPVSPGTYHLFVGVRPFRGDWLPVSPTDESPFVEIGEVIIR